VCEDLDASIEEAMRLYGLFREPDDQVSEGVILIIENIPAAVSGVHGAQWVLFCHFNEFSAGFQYIDRGSNAAIRPIP
jgi:hypothetical protein